MKTINGYGSRKPALAVNRRLQADAKAMQRKINKQSRLIRDLLRENKALRQEIEAMDKAEKERFDEKVKFFEEKLEQQRQQQFKSFVIHHPLRLCLIINVTNAIFRAMQRNAEWMLASPMHIMPGLLRALLHLLMLVCAPAAKVFTAFRIRRDFINGMVLKPVREREEGDE